MKKLILISAIAATTLFAEGLADIAQKAAVDHATKEATKAVSGEVAKVTGATEEKTEAAKTEEKDASSSEKTEAAEAKKEDANSSEKAEEPTSLKDQAIDAAAGHAADKAGVSKDVAKAAIKSAL